MHEKKSNYVALQCNSYKKKKIKFQNLIIFYQKKIRRKGLNVEFYLQSYVYNIYSFVDQTYPRGAARKYMCMYQFSME
jgi:hypothetical protein